MNITTAQQKLSRLGMELIKVLPYDLEAMTAWYLVEVDGQSVEMTSAEIKRLVK